MCRAQPNFTVLYPCDAVSAERLVALAAYHPGPAYIRTSRPKTPVIYANDETFDDRRAEGAARRARNDVATVVGAGVTVFEALKAYDQLKAGGHVDPRRSTSTRSRRSIAAGLIAAARRPAAA